MKIKEYYTRVKPKIVIVLSLTLLILAILNIYFTLEVRVTSNDECLWMPTKVGTDSTKINFAIVKENGVTWNAGIRNGYQLLEIDSTTIKTTIQAQLILNTFNSGQYVAYKVKKDDGTILNTKVYIKKLIQFGNLAYSILALIWLVIGFIVYQAKPNGLIQKSFFKIGIAAVFASSAVILPTNRAEAIQYSPIFLLTLSMLWALSFSFFPFLLLKFFLRFPGNIKLSEKKWVKYLLLIIPVILFLVIETGLLFIGLSDNNSTTFLQLLLRYIVFVNAGVILLSWVALLYNYRKLQTPEEKRPIFIILIAFTLGIAAIFYTAQIAPAITDSVFNSPLFYTPVILIVLLPISFGYSIFKYQLMDVSIVVKNTIVYGAATITLAALYFFLIYVIGQSISAAIGTEYQNIIAGVFFIGFALVFQSTKDKFQDFITARFYPEQFAYQKVLLRYSNDVASMVGLDNILDSTSTTLVEALMINRFGIMIQSQDKSSFILIRSTGIEKKNLVLRDTELSKIVTEKIVSGSPPVIDREEFSKIFPDAEEILSEENIFTIIPMIIKSEVVGLFLFGLKHSGAQFAGKDLELLSAAANQAAISIENARLYELESQKIKIEKELELAEKIQKGLLPRCIPEIFGLDICGEMKTAMQVGGDYYDLIEVSDKKLFVVVGDVSGKGLSASLYMAKLQTMMQLYCTDNKTPKEILVEVNRKLFLEMEKGWFVTLTLALFDMKKNKLSFCRAGHVPIIVSHNGKINYFKTTGLGLGLEKGPIFERTLVEETVDLSTGQLYSFFSDGITEAMNEKDHLFGEEKLAGILKNNSDLPSTKVMDSIWTELNLFCGKVEQYDDQTMVIVKIKA